MYVFNDHNVDLCSNEQPSFINQDTCRVSYEEHVCVKECVGATGSLVDVQLVMKFDDETLAKFHNTTAVDGIRKAHCVYAVNGLRWDASILERTVTARPCGPENPVSRWKPRPDLNVAACTNTLQEKSRAVLAHALETSNDDNPHLRDIYLWNDIPEDDCHGDDAFAYDMLVMTDEGCWENMHPDYM